MRVFNYKMLIVITFLTGSYFSCINSIQNTNEQKTEVDEYVNQVLERYGIPGAALAIIKDGKIQHQNCYKLTSWELNVPVDNSVLFQLSSLSKSLHLQQPFNLSKIKKFP